jgi:hypothetical protein
MTRTTFTLSAAALLMAIALPVSQARAQQDSAGGRSRAGAYDPAKSVALTGVTVLRIDTVKQGAGSSVNALLAVGKDSVTAWLAPAEFLSSKAITLAAGDVIDVTGSTLMAAGKQSLIATEIKKGETKVMLRDKTTGAPAWP